MRSMVVPCWLALLPGAVACSSASSSNGPDASMSDTGTDGSSAEASPFDSGVKESGVTDGTVADGGVEAGAVAGFAQKGPFILGSQIVIRELDPSLAQTGTSFSTTTVDDLGSFVIPPQVSAPYVDITASGYFYDEIQGALSASTLTLRTISESAPGHAIHVNLLTSVTPDRIVQLVAAGNSFTAARAQAETEAAALLGLSATPSSSFDSLDISQPGRDNAILLAASVIVDESALLTGPSSPVAQLSEIIAQLDAALAVDGGTIAPSLATVLKCTAPVTVDAAAVRASLTDHYATLGASVTIPAFETFLVPSPQCSDGGSVDGGDGGQGCLAGQWCRFPSTAYPRAHPTATLLAGGRVLVAGGDNSGGNPTQVAETAELFDPSANAWATPLTMSSGHSLHTATLLADGRVLLVGAGVDGNQTGVDIFDPSTSTFHSAAPALTQREAHVAALLPDGDVLVAGGEGPTGTAPDGELTSAEIYAPSTNVWTTTGSLTNGHLFCGATPLSGGNVLVGPAPWGMPELYDGGASTWSLGACDEAPAATWCPPTTTITGPATPPGVQTYVTLLPDGRILVLTAGMTTVALMYDPVGNTWSTPAQPSTGRYDATATLLSDGRVMFAGGQVGPSNTAAASVELYDPVANSWSFTGSLATARSAHAAVLLMNGTVLVVGGLQAAGTEIASAEIWGP